MLKIIPDLTYYAQNLFPKIYAKHVFWQDFLISDCFIRIMESDLTALLEQTTVLSIFSLFLYLHSFTNKKICLIPNENL